MDKTTQWIDSLKIHLLHPHATELNINQWLINHQQPCAIEKYLTIEIGADQKGVFPPITTKAQFLIDINLISDPDVSLCWIVGDQIDYPHRNYLHYLDWFPNEIRGRQESPHLGVIRMVTSTQPMTVILSYKELYLPNNLLHNLTQIPTCHTTLIDCNLQSCSHTNAFGPHPSKLNHIICLLPTTSKTIVEPEEEFIQI